jgi:hypothetical protein
VAALILPCGLLNAQIGTSTRLTGVTPAAPVFGQAVTLTAQVTPALAPGLVSFTDGGVLVGAGSLNANGIAHVTTPALPAGRHSLRAVYSGAGAGYNPSQSAAMLYIVTAVSTGGFAGAVNSDVGISPDSAARRNFNDHGKANLALASGRGVGTLPVLGGGVTTKVGILRSSARPAEFTTAEDVNGNLAWDPGTDQAFFFGSVGDILIQGDWDGPALPNWGFFGRVPQCLRWT